ncbi:large ribosomal subunit protein P2B-like [Lycium ferocissimum]|uniref:large ribosomal subunit protein P2B-like n=1 Tax=Lycium ferocissimum TaxID=112874 RepID=UPI002814BC19|nr:large ribosomal subunit protein P2B-like [Lycium ferocissimum]
MDVITTYLLDVWGGNISPTAEDLKALLSSVGAEADEAKIELLLSQVKGKDLTELIAAGREMIALVPSGGSGVAVASGGGGAVVAEEKVEEKKVEEKEESEEEFGFDLSAWHGRQRQRATRAEKMRLQALKADDQEAYMKMLEETKNERLIMLLRKTNELLAKMEAAIQR